MIDPIDPECQPYLKLAISDIRGSYLTVHAQGGLAGMVVSQPGVGAASIRLDRADRAALIRELIELQEDESIS